MSRFSKLLKATKLILRKPHVLNKIIDDNEEWKSSVLKKYRNIHTCLPVVNPEDMFERKIYSVEPYTFTDGGSLLTDILLLKNGAASFENCTYFEFGTWRGESAANVASVATDCFTLNLSDEEMRRLNFPDIDIQQIGLFSNNLKNVTHLKGNSLAFDFASLKKKFDLIFIDGNHHYKYVKSDTENTFRHLIHKRSIVMWHDYAMNPEKIRYEILAGILDGTPQEYHKNIYHAEGTLTAVYIPIDLEGKSLIRHETPKKVYSVELKLKN